jgi:ribosomal protein S6--L-glutamate ligase
VQLPLIVLTRSPAYYTSKRLLEAAHARGLTTCCVDSGATESEALHQLTRHLGGDAYPGLILPRIGSRHTTAELRLLSSLIARGLFSPSSPRALATAMDKAATHRALMRAGLPTVSSRPVSHPEDVLEAARDLGAGPWVIKPCSGSQGRDVLRADTESELQAMCHGVLERNPTALIQPLIRMRRPRDLRVLIVDGVAQAACWRIAGPGEFRSNVHLGATSKHAELSREVETLAEAAAATVGLTHAGVDLLPLPPELQRGDATLAPYLVLEVNGSPGLEAIEAVTRRDLAGLVVDDALRAFSRHQADPSATISLA